MSFDGAFRAFERVTAALAAVAAVLILGMSLWITADVSARFLFNVSFPWAFDLSEYALVWITFLGAPWVLMQDRHIRIELLVEAMPLAVQRAMGIAVSVLGIAVCAVLTWRTGIAAIDYASTGQMMPRIWRIPRIWPYAVLPLGSALLTLAFVFRLGLYLRRPDPEAALRARASEGQADPGSG